VIDNQLPSFADNPAFLARFHVVDLEDWMFPFDAYDDVSETGSQISTL